MSAILGENELKGKTYKSYHFLKTSYCSKYEMRRTVDPWYNELPRWVSGFYFRGEHLQSSLYRKFVMKEI